ncbi:MULTISPECIES: AvrE-family type 3 secretion system effector [Enterobacteriaceae]|uniref:AvrE-family type 3 secretion system effector n=1 Tax=Enterobacteriaceae TaxID=543 RepID=UPI000550C799|nr:AvrE-family type 3 secretion system effector [Enterobacter sp. Ag1]
MGLGISAFIKPGRAISDREITDLQQGRSRASAIKQSKAPPTQIASGSLHAEAGATLPPGGLRQSAANTQTPQKGMFSRFLGRHRNGQDAAQITIPATASASRASSPSLYSQASASRATSPSLYSQPSASSASVYSQPDVSDPNAIPSNEVGTPGSHFAELPLEIEPEKNMLLETRLSLDKKGRLEIDTPATSAPLHALMEKTIGHDRLRYQNHLASDDGHQHVLLDKEGRLMTLRSQPGVFIALSHSQQKVEWREVHPPHRGFMRRQSLAPAGQHLSWHDRQTVEIGGEKVRLPETGIRDRLTDSVTDGDGTRYRLHDKKLFSFDSAANAWQSLSGEDDKLSSLSRQSDGMLWRVNDDKQLGSAVGDTIKVNFEHKIDHYAVGPKRDALVLLSDDEKKPQVAYVANLAATDPQPKMLTLPENMTLKKTALHGPLLFALDNNGRLHCGDKPDAQSTALTFGEARHKPLLDNITQYVAATVEDGARIEDMLADETDRLHLIVKDKYDQKHAITFHWHGGDLKPQSSWNLSDSLVLDYQKGLPQVTPAAHDVVDLGRLGKLALHDGKVHYFNETTGLWAASDEKADKLQCGLDGQPWLMKDGELKRLKVNLSSNKVDHGSNVFALPQVTKSVSADLATAGLDKAEKAQAFTAIDSRRYLAVNEKGDIGFHHIDTTTRRNQRATQTLSQAALQQQIEKLVLGSAGKEDAAKVSDLALGEDKQLWLLSKEGSLFSLPENGWNSGKADGLAKVTLPANEDGSQPELTALQTSAKGQVSALDKQGNTFVFKAGAWEKGDPATAPVAEPNMARQHYERLTKASKDWRLPGTGITFKREVNFLGQTGQDGKQVRTSFRTRLSTFVFRPSLEWPRPIKTAAYSIQHRYAGREGLKDVYQQQGDLTQRLKALSQQPGRAAPRPGLSQRLEIMSGETARQWQPQEKALLEEMSSFARQLSDSSTHYCEQIGQHYGVRDERRQEATPSRFGLNHSQSGALNPSSSRQDNLTGQLNELLRRYPADKSNHAGAIIAELEARKITLNHQKEQVPMGRQRDIHDDIGLVKSRVMLDVLALKSLHDSVDELQQASLLGEPQRSAKMTEIAANVARLRDSEWGGNVIKTVTTQGFGNHKSLEANYDAIKAMTKAFSKENHGVNINTKTVMQAENQREMQDKMVSTVLSLESGENLAFSRTYGASATATVAPGTQVVAGVGGKVGADRGYTMSFSRGDTGINVSFGRTGAVSATGIVGVGYNVLTDYNKTHKVYLDGDHKHPLSQGVRLGGGVTLGGQLQSQHGVSFELAEHEIPGFIEQLSSGTLDPLEFLNRGANHSVKSGATQSFSVDINAAALASVGFPFTDSHEKDFPTSARLGGGVYANTNLLAGSRERTDSRNAEGQGVSHSDHRLRAFNQMSAGANIAIPVSTTLQPKHKDPFSVGVGVGASVQLSINNRTTHSLTVDLKNAQPVEGVHLEKLMTTLGKQFTDSASTQLLAKLKEEPKEGELPISVADKLSQLDAHFTRWYPPADNAKARRPLLDTLQQLTARQQQADSLSVQNTQPEPTNAEVDALITGLRGEFTDLASRQLLDELTPAEGAPRLPMSAGERLGKLETHFARFIPPSRHHELTGNGPQAALQSLQQTVRQQNAVLNQQQLVNKAEYQSTYKNLSRIDNNGLFHFMRHFMEGEFSPSNADRITQMMGEDYRLKALLRGLQDNSSSQAVVSLELKTKPREKLADQWANHTVTQDSIVDLLKDRDKLRLKSIAFTKTQSKSDGFSTPSFLLGGSNGVSLSMNENLGTINFSYGDDDSAPLSYTVDGGVAQAEKEVKSALQDAAEAGFMVKGG